MGGPRNRRRVWPAALVAAAMAMTLALGTGSAMACSCALPATAEQALAGAELVFVGTVVEFGGVVHRDPERGLFLRGVRLHVSEVSKGPVPEVVQIHTPDGGEAACGYEFEVGRDELVYAHRGDGGPVTAGLCSRTTPVDRAAADLEALGDGVPPVPVAPPTDIGPGWLLPVAAVTLLLVPLVTWVVLRPGRARPPRC